MALLVDTIVFGIISGTLVAIGAVGFTLQYGVTNVLNLAYGSILTSAIFIGYLVSQHTTALWLLLVVGAAWGAGLSYLLGMGLLARYVRRGTNAVGVAIVTVSVGLIIQFGLEAIQGPGLLSFQSVAGSPFHIFNAVVSTTQVMLVAVAVGLMTLMHLLLRHTRLGLAMRATSADASLSRGCGISTNRVRSLSWLISGGLCGVTGIILGVSVGAFNSTTGNDLFILIVAAAIVGGIGRPYGAMVGGLLLGIVSEGTAAVLSPALDDVVACGVIVLVLVARPQGIFSDYAPTRSLAQ
jgi:branched-chain amino acid transport system permease protein/neutral amino acid transport system permease protein